MRDIKALDVSLSNAPDGDSACDSDLEGVAKHVESREVERKMKKKKSFGMGSSVLQSRYVVPRVLDSMN
jgi:hypothetical protein